MEKQKIKYLLILLVLLALAVIYMLRGKNQVHSNARIAIKNTDDIYKIFLSDMNNKNITLQKTENGWTLNDSLKPRMDAIETILQTIHLQEPQQPVTNAQSNYIVSTLSTHGIKVMLYNKANENISTFFVGGSGPKGIGTYMYKQGADRPYLYNANGFTGDLSTRYFTKLDDWLSRDLLQYNTENINYVAVNYADHKDSNFIVEGLLTNRKISNNGKEITSSLGTLNAFISNFKMQKVAGWENSNFAKDSLLNKNRYYGSIIVGQSTTQNIDTFLLYYCPADQKSKNIHIIQNQYFDLNYLFVWHNKMLGLITTESLAPILTTPNRFSTNP